MLYKWSFFTIILSAFSMYALSDIQNNDENYSSPVEGNLSFNTHQDQGSQPERSSSRRNRIRPNIEAKIGYFFFGGHKMRKIYDDGGLDLQLSGSYPIWRWLEIYGSAEFIEKHGRSLEGEEKTRIWEYPFSLGLKAVVPIGTVTQYYFTIGPRYIYVHVHNNSPHVDRKLNHSGIGGFVGTGFNFFFSRNFFLDLFGEYSYARLHFHAHKKNVYGERAQVGGFAFGGGLGYAF